MSHSPTEPGAASPEAPPSRDRLWPLLITGGLLVVVLVNFAFVWIAMSGAEEVSESYVTAER